MNILNPDDPQPITRQQVAGYLPPRPRDSHKGMFGTVAVIGGARGMNGAALLAARAALRLGAGRVHIGWLADDAPAVDIVQPELMLHSAQAALGLPGLDVIAIGCGMGQDVHAQNILHDALNLDAALVLDADALNIIATRPDLATILRLRQPFAIMTPHPGEAAHLLGISGAQVQAGRLQAAQQLAQRYNCAVVLKGADSLCVTRAGEILINGSGNPGMSGPGMGDVLSGMIAAFIAQKVEPGRAMLLAVHLHGAAGDALAQQHVGVGMTATEVTEQARHLLNLWLSSISERALPAEN
ncbi:MAG: NAD(P)H-hydrate dehydratase [Pseudomonadota bacterium]